MLELSPKERDDITRGFENALNRHGFSFQHAVLKECERLCSKAASGWLFQVAEFPIEVRGKNTHIDFVLTLERNEWHNSEAHPETPVYLIAECKRSDPALNRWCFARAPYVNRSGRSDHFIVERIIFDHDEQPFRFRSGGAVLKKDAGVYHIGLEIKSRAKGDGTGGGRSAIDDAITQAFVGSNGMVEHLFRVSQANWQGHPRGAVILPVVFTTARLFVSDIDIGSADLASGNIEMPADSLREEPWIPFQSHGSVGLKHKRDSIGESLSLGDVLNAEYVRTIPIVNARHIERFINQFQIYLEDLRDCP